MPSIVALTKKLCAGNAFRSRSAALLHWHCSGTPTGRGDLHVRVKLHRNARICTCGMHVAGDHARSIEIPPCSVRFTQAESRDGTLGCSYAGHLKDSQPFLTAATSADIPTAHRGHLAHTHKRRAFKQHTKDGPRAALLHKTSTQAHKHKTST